MHASIAATPQKCESPAGVGGGGVGSGGVGAGGGVGSGGVGAGGGGVGCGGEGVGVARGTRFQPYNEEKREEERGREVEEEKYKHSAAA